MADSKVETRKVSDLKPHPRQREFFRIPSDAELTELADDIDKNGLRNPPHIAPDDTILMGHRRIEACKNLGWDEVEVVVRYDLDGDDDRAMYEFVSDNLCRQQLDPIGIAKCYEELRVLEGRLGDAQRAQRPGELRDRIAAKMPVKMSGRQLDRLRRLLKLPLPIQDAIRKGNLKANHGEMILGLSQKTQQEIAAALEGGEAPASIIQRFTLKNLPTSQSPDQTMKAVLKSLAKALPVLQGNLDAVDSVSLGSDRKTIQVLKGAAEFFVEVRGRWESHSAKSATDPPQFTRVGFRSSPDKISD